MTSKLYTNTLVMILNNRLTVRGGRDDIDEGNNIALWGVNMTPIHSWPNRGSPPSPINDTLVIREVWRESADILDIVSLFPYLLKIGALHVDTVICTQ